MTSPRLLGWGLALPALVFTGLMLALPLGRTLLEGGVNVGVWRDPYFLGRLGWTLTQALGTAALALLIGGPLAYLLSRYAVPGKALFLRLLLLPFVTPTLVAVLGLSALLGPQGWVTRLTSNRLLSRSSSISGVCHPERSEGSQDARHEMLRLRLSRTKLLIRTN